MMRAPADGSAPPDGAFDAHRRPRYPDLGPPPPWPSDLPPPPDARTTAMLRLDAPRPVSFCDGLTRRDFLHAGTLAPLGLALPQLCAAKARGAAPDTDVNCILLFLVGGPSQIDTWDPKPDAPAEVRGPFQPTATNVPGMRISEIFPQMAKHADKYSLIRSVYHTATAVHDSGHQLMQTGRFFSAGVEHPHIGCTLGYLKGGRGALPAHVLVP